ncbi:MAG: hypothetical protein ACREXR_14570, partial [Gammaproteobacteria bacterium]
KKLYRLNKIYAKEIEYFAINDSLGQSPGYVMKEDFSDDLQITPAIDLGSATQTGKIEKAKMVYGWAIQNPIVMNSPPHLYEASKRFLEAIGEVDIDAILPRPEVIAEQQQAQGAKQEEMMQAQMAIKEAELDQGQQELDIKRMATQADIEINKFKTQTDAVSKDQKDKVARHSFATRTDQQDEELRITREQIAAEDRRAVLKAQVAQAKTAADFETAVAKLKSDKRAKTKP